MSRIDSDGYRDEAGCGGGGGAYLELGIIEEEEGLLLRNIISSEMDEQLALEAQEMRYAQESASERVIKSVRNPNGKNGGAAHQSTIQSIKAPKGTQLQFEQRYDTPGGYKTKRFADAVEIKNDEITKIHQVGKVNQNRMPVLRESRAIEDIMKSSDYNGAPVYFWPYNNPSMGPIIFMP